MTKWNPFKGRIVSRKYMIPLRTATSTVLERVTALMQSVDGAWLDPEDSSLSFQDVNGTASTVAGSYVGLVLDKRTNLAKGPEIVSNGSFDTATGWTLVAGSTISGGVLSLSAPATNVISAYVVPLGKRLAVSLAVSSYSAGTLNMHMGGSTRSISGNGAYSYITAATTATTSVRILSSGFPALALDNLSVKELLGNHAAQATSTARPVLASSPARHVFDGIDDVHTITFSSALGANCTVATAVPGVGTAIQTGVNIGTTYSITSTHAGMLLINRPLTTQETLDITSYLNGKAGV